MEYDYMDCIMNTRCASVNRTVNFCYSFERLSYQGEEEDQVVPKVFVFVVCLFNIELMFAHVYMLRG